VRFFHLLPFDPKSAFPFATKKIRIKVHITTISHLLCGCETCSFVLREYHRLRMFAIEVLRMTFGLYIMMRLMTCMFGD
jgi:hypothetical protein